MEYWDLLDRDRKPLGVTHPRGRQYPMPRGSYHTVVMIITADRDGRVLVTRRAPTKGMYPNCWEITCGSAIAGEDSRTAAERELVEETGIPLSDHAVLLDTLVIPQAFMDVYFNRLDASAEDVAVTLQEGETVDFRWVSLYELDRMINRGELPPPVAMRYGCVRRALIESMGWEIWAAGEPDGVSPDAPVGQAKTTEEDEA